MNAEPARGAGSGGGAHGADGGTRDDARFVVGLGEVGAGALGTAGGKAVNLGELVRAGFPVPPGFVVTTAAYERIVAANRLEELVARAAHDAPSAAAARDAFARATIPAEVERAILTAYHRLGNGAVAVRSSATAEDLPEAAFAGQQETFLGVLGADALLDAVRECWSSLWTDRAISYRQRHDIDNATVKLAVVVQQMVDAEDAGVLFTANPVTGARNEAVIAASTGLGEAVVGGLVTPDDVVLRNTRHRWQIVERRLGQREIEIRPRPGGGTEQVAGRPSDQAVLPDAVLRQLARIGVSIQRHFGRPQDVEWAWADGKLFILQSRPITALPAPPPRRGRFQPSQFAADYLQVRPYPLDVTSWMRAMETALPRMIPVGGLIPPLNQSWVEEDGVIERFAGWPSPRLTPELLLVPGRILALALRYDPARWREDPILGDMLTQMRELEARDLSALSWPELLATARQAMALALPVMEIRRRYFPRGALALVALRLMLGLIGLGDRFATLLSGVDNLTLAANRALETLATEIRTDPALAAVFSREDPGALAEALRHSRAGRAFLDRFTSFLDAYGHRETGSPLLVSQPTWKDTPDTVLSILQGLARAEPPSRQGQPDWEATRDEALAHPWLQIPLARTIFLRVLEQARRVLALREDTHFLMTLPLPILRRTLVELGQRLVSVGILETAEDVFHLTFAELERGGDPWPPPPALAAELRAAARRRAERRAALADTPLMDLPSLVPATADADALVIGTPGSPGIAEGAVRVVREAAAFGSLRPGEVLAAPYTNPSWTPLFGRAAAVVVDTGSALSHAAIVAREYGIPAVMGTGDGTRRLRNGQRVRVDGGRGLVFAAEGDVGERSDGL